MWYPCFIAATVLLACYGRPSDRPAWSVIAAASLVSAGMSLWLDTIDAPWKLVLYCALELATAGVLVRVSLDLISRLMLAATAVAWLAHSTLYLDLLLGTSLIYDTYERVLLCIALFQLAAGLGGFRHAAASLRRFVAQRLAGARRARVASCRADSDRGAGVEGVSETQSQ